MKEDDRVTRTLVNSNVQLWGPGAEEELANSHVSSITRATGPSGHSNSLSTVTML